MGDPVTAGTTRPADVEVGAPQTRRPVPGLVMVFADQRPSQRVLRLDGPLELGRGDFAEEDAREQLISRRHVRLGWEAGELRVRDLDSRNGSFISGQRISGEARLPLGATLRLGGVLLLASADVLPFLAQGSGVRDSIVSGPIVSGPIVCGPALRQALDSIALTRRMDLVPSLLLSGETGSGKEIAAQVFHAAASALTPRTPSQAPGAPFVAVNCATIPKELAERLLFGSRRGAFSGATDAPGHVQAAHGGTLFLDEIAELPLEVQSKLLRMLETREVLRLGSTRPEPVDVRICAATWRDLRAEVAAGRFREDLFFRIGQPEVRLPALRERVDEIPWHVQSVLDGCAPAGRLRPSVAFIEACALRPWPGNVRELRAEVRRAAAAALARGAELLGASDLAPRAGLPLHSVAPSAPAYPLDDIADALRAEKGNVVRAAKRLGVDRNRVRRWLDRHSLDAEQFKH